jgi:hypothetical protein
MSAWTIVWLAVQVIESPGARLRTGRAGTHTRSLTFGSVTTTLVSVTFPVFVAVIV